VFLTKYVQAHYTVQIAETHNHVLLLVRDLDNVRTDDFARMLRLTYKYADQIFNEQFKPVSAEALKLFRTSLSPAYIYGYYNPKMEALTNRDTSGDLITSAGLPNERSTSAKASAVRFFCNGDFAGFMVLKPLFGAELKNPFDPRFKRLSTLEPGEVPFWDRPRAGSPRAALAEEQVTRRQVEEYLGNYFYDEQGNKLSQRIPIKELERAFRELSREQQLEIVRRKMIDEFYTSGTEAFVRGDVRSALSHWTSILRFDPENPRAAILLQMAIRQYSEGDAAPGEERARTDQAVAAAQEAIARQQTMLALKREQKQQEEVKESAVVNFRTRALDFLSEGNYQESLNEWNKLLNVDPGNASALIFKEICEQKMRERSR
jgi:tetratricopeptide (TPR) repeat protein